LSQLGHLSLCMENQQSVLSSPDSRCQAKATAAPPAAPGGSHV